MNEEHDGTDQGKPSEEEYERFRRMMDGMGREGLRRMVEHLTERIEANPRDAEALGGRGLAYAELGEHRQAVEDYGRIIALDPGNAGAHLGRARAYGRLDERRLAVEDYDAALRLAPGDAVAHYSRGACKAELGDLAGAMSDFDVAVTMAPGDADAHYNRGLTQVAMGKRHRAVKDLSRAIDLNPNLADAHYHRGMAYRDMGRMDRAVRDFDAAVEIEERYGLAFYARGITNVNLGAHEAALGDFDAVLELDPDNAPALRGRGIALGSLGRFDEAVGDFGRSLELDPGNAEALAARGLAHSSLEQYELAIEDYSRVIDLDPRNRDVLYSRGIARMYAARFESAIEDFEAILGIEPGHAAARGARGLARETLEMRGGAGEGVGPRDAGDAGRRGRGAGGAVAPPRGRESRGRFERPLPLLRGCRRRAEISGNKKRRHTWEAGGRPPSMGDGLPPERRPGVLRRAVAHASLGGCRLRLLQHGGVARHQDGRHRHPARAVVTGAVGVLRLRAPGHPAADPDGGTAEPAAAPRPARAMHHHPAPLALPPAQHLHLGGHDPLLRLRAPEQHGVQPLQHARRRTGLAVHDLGEVRGADAGPPCDLVLAEAVSVHAVPQGLGVHAGKLRGRDRRLGLQRRLDQRLDPHAHALAAA